MGLIERNFVEDLDPDALDNEGIKLVNDEVGVQWVLSFLSSGDPAQDPVCQSHRGRRLCIP